MSEDPVRDWAETYLPAIYGGLGVFLVYHGTRSWPLAFVSAMGLAVGTALVLAWDPTGPTGT